MSRLPFACSLLFAAFGGLLLTSCSEEEHLIPVPMTEQFAENLTAYDIYQGELQDLVPTNDYHLLELNSPLFSNYSEKQRLVKLPVGTQILENGNGIPIFPEGTILVKTFYYFHDERDESLGKQVIETRLLIKKEGLWNVATYIWNDAQTEATLTLNGFDKQVRWTDASGTDQVIDYHFPDQNECVACHQQNAEVFPIGPSLRNLNIEVTRDNFTTNQLAHLQYVGLMNDFDVAQVEEIPDYKNEALALSARGRAYLDMNCAHCHNPAAWSKSADRNFDLRFETSLGDSRIVNKKDEIIRVIQEGEMPYLGTTVIDKEGVDLLVQYLRSL